MATTDCANCGHAENMHDATRACWQWTYDKGYKQMCDCEDMQWSDDKAL